MKNSIFKNLIIIFILLFFNGIFQINYWNIKKQKLNHPTKGIRKQIADSEDKIRSLNSVLSKWTSETNMTIEAKKLKFKKMEPDERVILENETDS